MKRSDFLTRVAAIAVAPRGLVAVTARPGWAGVRDAFALRADESNFAAWYFASHPRPVRDAIARHRSELDADARTYMAAHEDELTAAARAAAARYLRTSPHQVALTDSTTMGLGLLYAGIRLRAGQELVTSTHDFYATHEALRVRALRTGARLTKAELYARPAQASVDEIVSKVERALGARTRVLALTWVHSSTGVKLPVREIARVVARKNASRDAHDRILFCLDGVHGFGVEAATPDELGVDFLVSGCHKWLFGPRGTGVVWGRRDAWAEVSPTIPSFDNAAYGAWIRGVTPSGPAGPLQTPGGFHTMEHRWALKEAFAWRTQLGAARVEARTHALARRLKDGLDGVALVTPRSQALSAGLVMASLPRDPDETVRLLYERHRIVASVTPYRERYVRLGPSIVNDEHEVDVAARALRELA